MSEDDGRPVAPASESGGAAQSFGARLAAARERAGISVTEVAARLRLHPKQVRALEEENLAALPEAAYVRGFLRSYARLVGIDSAPLLDDLNAKLSPPDASVVDGMARTRDYSPVKAASREHTSRVLVLGLALIALIALGFIGWYVTQRANEPPAPAAKVEVPRTAPAADSASSVNNAVSVPTSASPDAAEPSSAAEPAQSSESAAQAPESAPPALLTLQFSGASWVEVTDAAGKVVLSQLGHDGELLQASGALPLAVVIGDASKVAVKVRGEPLDLEAVTRSNVARFSVK